MKSFAEQLSELAEAGYRVAEAQAKVAHDAILLAMYKSGFKKNCTVKGGVVMCELTKAVRRTAIGTTYGGPVGGAVFRLWAWACSDIMPTMIAGRTRDAGFLPPGREELGHA